MGDCQNCGPFWVIRIKYAAPSIQGTQKGTILLTATIPKHNEPTADHTKVIILKPNRPSRSRMCTTPWKPEALYNVV